MSQTRAKELSEKTRAAYEQVVEHQQKESLLAALKKVTEEAARAGSAEERRQTLDIEKAHLREVIDAKSRLQETVGALIAGYDQYADDVNLIEVPDDYNPLLQLQKNVARNKAEEVLDTVPLLD